MNEFCLDFLNGLTKYPSIPTYHDLGPRGVPEGSPPRQFGRSELWSVTEKVDGTNARVIVTPDGDWFIGSREELLLSRGDRIGDPSQFIVETLRPHLSPLVRPRTDEIEVVYVEVYGHKIGRAGKQYTSGNERSFRVFDVQRIEVDLAMRLAATYSHAPNDVAEWRETGSHWWLPWDDLKQWCTWSGSPRIQCVPEILRLSGPLITKLDLTAEWLVGFQRSQATLDSEAGGRAEGVVVRSLQRRLLVKLRFEDYARLHPTPRKKVAAS